MPNTERVITPRRAGDLRTAPGVEPGEGTASPVDAHIAAARQLVNNNPRLLVSSLYSTVRAADPGLDFSEIISDADHNPERARERLEQRLATLKPDVEDAVADANYAERVPEAIAAGSEELYAGLQDLAAVDANRQATTAAAHERVNEEFTGAQAAAEAATKAQSDAYAMIKRARRGSRSRRVSPLIWLLPIIGLLAGFQLAATALGGRSPGQAAVLLLGATSAGLIVALLLARVIPTLLGRAGLNLTVAELAEQARRYAQSALDVSFYSMCAAELGKVAFSLERLDQTLQATDHLLRERASVARQEALRAAERSTTARLVANAFGQKDSIHTPSFVVAQAGALASQLGRPNLSEVIGRDEATLERYLEQRAERLLAQHFDSASAMDLMTNYIAQTSGMAREQAEEVARARLESQMIGQSAEIPYDAPFANPDRPPFTWEAVVAPTDCNLTPTRGGEPILYARRPDQTWDLLAFIRVVNGLDPTKAKWFIDNLPAFEDALAEANQFARLVDAQRYEPPAANESKQSPPPAGANGYGQREVEVQTRGAADA